MKKLNKKPKAIIFDLDDTLYDEYDFVQNGFKATARFLSEKFQLNSQKTEKLFKDKLKKFGRGKVFDLALNDLKIKPTKTLIKKLVSVYRYHDNLKLAFYPGAENLLKKLRQERIKLALVTNTNWRVQARKVKVLGAKKYFETVLYPNYFGLCKPEKDVYIKTFQRLGFKSGEEILCIGDDPNCDFVTAKKLGCQTIRIRQGRLKNVTLDKKNEADIEVSSIQELTKLLLK